MLDVVSTQLTEVSTSQLSEHSLQAQLSPDMKKKEMASLLADISKNGILQPLFVTKGFKVIDGRHRLKCAKELGIENVTVVFVDIPENEIASYIVTSKLSRDNLTKGQRAAIIINLHYEEERRNAKERQGARNDLATLPSNDGEVKKKPTAKVLAEMAGISLPQMERLIAAKKKRQDLFMKVFEGVYTIGKVYAQMKRDENPLPTEDELTAKQAEIVAAINVAEVGASQFDTAKPMTDPYNVAVGIRKNALSASASIINDTSALKAVEDEKVKREAREQIMSLVQSGIISLGQTAETDEESDILAVCLELLEKIGGM